MAFTSWIYGLMLVTATAIYWLLPGSRRDYFLMAAGMVFIGYHFPWHVLLLFVISTLVYWAGNRIRNRRIPALTAVSIVVLVLAYFKYQELAAEILRRLALWVPAVPSFKAPQLLVPLGISFFTFRLIHYLVDSYRGTRPDGSYGQFLLYIFFFPILPSGPIERWQNFLGQNRELGDFRWDYLAEGGRRIITGLFKKLVIADVAAVYAAKMQVAGYGSIAYWVMAYAYAIQIYFDFSGYSDVAIGSARLFGYRIMENFDHPYLKRNISLFWKSWHMSLTSWFRDYVFIPLGGSRASFPRTVFNTLVVMGLTGLWHGAALHFIAWGLYHGVGLIILRIYNMLIGKRLPERWRESRTAAVMSTLLTFHFVVIGWVFFATDFEQSIYIIRKLLFLA